MTYKRSVFPEGGIDTLQEIFDLPPSQLSNAERFQYLKTKSNKTQTEINELNSLTIALQNYIIDSEKWNKFCDICINLETFFQNEVQGYIDTKQAEFDAKLNTFSYQGQYDSVETYKQWNVVTYNYETYISRQDNNLNHTPIGDTNDLWWFKSGARGATGLGIGLVFRGSYNNATAYEPNQCVNYNGNIYYTTQSTTGNIPTDTNFWGLFQANMSPMIQPTQPSAPTLGQIWIQTGI